MCKREHGDSCGSSSSSIVVVVVAVVVVVVVVAVVRLISATSGSDAAGHSMAGAEALIPVCKHLQAAATDILQEELHPFPGPLSPGTRYIIELLQAYWSTATAPEIIHDIQALFPRRCVFSVAAFCSRNYPELLLHFLDGDPSVSWSIHDSYIMP